MILLGIFSNTNNHRNEISRSFLCRNSRLVGQIYIRLKLSDPPCSVDVNTGVSFLTLGQWG